MRERFLDSCEDRLALYLRERSPGSLDEVISLADHYLDARSSKIVSKTPKTSQTVIRNLISNTIRYITTVMVI